MEAEPVVCDVKNSLEENVPDISTVKRYKHTAQSVTEYHDRPRHSTHTSFSQATSNFKT